MVREKFQQKAPKQTKQKKSKSAEFLMVKEDGEAIEGIGNPAFNMSSPDLSAQQTSKENVIRHDMPDHTLAALHQKSRLPASAEEKGNECGRNYFDPLMEEEINPRQCAMEVIRQVPQGDGRVLYNQSMKLFHDRGREAFQDEKSKEETFDLEVPMSSSKNEDTHKEAEEVMSAYNEEFEKETQRNTILFARSLSEQDLKLERKTLNQNIPMSCLKMDKTSEKHRTSGQPLSEDLDVCMKQCSFAEEPKESKGTEGACCKGEPSQSPLQVQIVCVRGLKDKAPEGSYCLRVSLLDRLGSCVSKWWQTEPARTHPVHHGGNFYDVGLYFHEGLSMVLPQRKGVKPGLSFLFELFLLPGASIYSDLVVGWGVFPVCDNNFSIVEGRFKCPLLRGHYDRKLDSFRKIEDLICQDLDQWLCNLYFKVIKLLPHLNDQKGHESCTEFSPEFPVCLMVGAANARLDVDHTAGHPDKEPETNICASVDSVTSASQGSISNKIDPCTTDCDLRPFKEVHELQHKGLEEKSIVTSCSGDSFTDHRVKEKPTVRSPREPEDHLQDLSYLEELEKHRFSVCCSSAAESCGFGDFSKHLCFALMSLFSELELAQWRSQGFWYIILLMASLWFPRLYLHYLGQWLFLQAISTPVTKFHFYSYTVELCYPTSPLHVGDELAVMVVGPLALNTITFPLLLIRWGCQLLFSSCPDALSKLIITMGLWTVLDPLAVFLVDAFLGRLSSGEETPTADAVKLYWMLVSTKQPAILGAVSTVILYTLLFVISALILYLYCLRLQNNFWVLDAFQRIHSDEAKFFMPHDLEISNQELSYIVKRSEQWRGISGERRKVAVHDYICKSHGTESSVSSCDLQHQSEISLSALSPGGVTSYVSVYTVYPSGFQELYRHFLRLPDGAIIEVFGDISTLKFVPREVTTAIEEQMREMDTAQGETCAITQGKS